MYIPIQEYDQFKDLADFGRKKVTEQLINTVRHFHESEDMEELLLQAVSDPNRTPHGPVEIVDIMTLQLSHRNEKGLAGIILKGRSFKTITPAHISHQVFRLRKISNLKFAVFGHVGMLLDEAREEFIHTATDLEVDYTIIDSGDFARIAVVFGRLCPRDAKPIEDGKCSCGYRIKGDHLNLLQKDALSCLNDTHSLGQESGVVIMPTGSGKTRIAALDSYESKAKRVLYIAHTHEILDGAEREFQHVFGVNAVHRGLCSNSSLPQPSVHLCTIQSIRKRIDNLKTNQYDYIVIDEFHHAAATSYRTLISKTCPDFLLGLTATPFRGDRQDVVQLCNGNVIVNFELRTGIDSGILAPYNYYGCFDDIDYSRLDFSSGRYIIKDLNKSLIIPARDKAIISKWRKLAMGLPSLAFCCSHEHAKRMAISFEKDGIPAKEYLSSTPAKYRNELIEKLQYGDLKVLCVVDVLNEGIDLPFVECLLFLRPTESKRIFYQQLGRGLRKYPGKDHVVVLDFIGNFHNAYRIVEYLGLLPEDQTVFVSSKSARTSKEVLNLPLNCKVSFDDRVIDVFASQVFDPRRVSRSNIAQVLIYLYRKTSKSLGRPATRQEVDRIQLLHSGLYKLVFGNWRNFEQLMQSDEA